MRWTTNVGHKRLWSTNVRFEILGATNVEYEISGGLKMWDMRYWGSKHVGCGT